MKIVGIFIYLLFFELKLWKVVGLSNILYIYIFFKATWHTQKSSTIHKVNYEILKRLMALVKNSYKENKTTYYF